MLHAVTMPFEAWQKMARVYLDNTERVQAPKLDI